MINIPTALLSKYSSILTKKAHIDLFAEIKVRHYSPKTLRSYSIRVKQFQSFTKNKKINIFY